MGQDSNRLVGLEGPEGEDCKVSFSICRVLFHRIPSYEMMEYLDMESAAGAGKLMVDQVPKMSRFCI